MNCRKTFSSIEISSDESTPSGEESSRERLGPAACDDEPFVTIECNNLYNEQDPLIDDGSIRVSPNISHMYYSNRPMFFYDPFFNEGEEPRGNKYGHDGVGGTHRPLDSLEREERDSRTIINQDPACDVNRQIPPVSHLDSRQLQIQREEVVDDPPLELRELFQLLLQKIEERKRAAYELRQKRKAENALAKQLVAEIRGQQTEDWGQPTWKEELTAKQRRDAVNAESALARQLVQRVCKGCPLEKIVQELKPLPSPYQLLKNREDRDTRVSGADKAAKRTEASLVPAKRLQRESSRDSDHPAPSPASLLQQPSQSQAVTCNEFTNCDIANLSGCIVEERVEGDEWVPVSEQGTSEAISQPSPPWTSPTILSPLMPTGPSRSTNSSLLCAVHPSHLFPSYTPFEVETEDERTPEFR